MPIMYKLVSQDYLTNNSMKWEIGVKNKALAKGKKMCSNQVLHCYASPGEAALFNKFHADIQNPRLLEIECSEIVNTDKLKYACKEQTPIRELPFPQFSQNQKIAIMIKHCLFLAEKESEKTYIDWANNWLGGIDRSIDSAKNMMTYYYPSSSFSYSSYYSYYYSSSYSDYYYYSYSSYYYSSSSSYSSSYSYYYSSFKSNLKEAIVWVLENFQELEIIN